MGWVGRILVQLVAAVIISAAMIMLITARLSGPMSELEVRARWAVLLIKKAPAARVASDIWGTNPPLWAQRLAVIWERADMPQWWWLPLVMLAVRWMVVGIAQRRVRRMF